MKPEHFVATASRKREKTNRERMEKIVREREREIYRG